MLKYTNQEKTAATFNGSGVTLSAPEDWDSIGDTPTREAVLNWIAEGNTPDPADPLPQPIIAITPWQIRKALNELSLRESVELAVRSADQDTQDAWQYATEFIRTDPLVVELGLALGKTDEDLDQLFALAASL